RRFRFTFGSARAVEIGEICVRLNERRIELGRLAVFGYCAFRLAAQRVQVREARSAFGPVGAIGLHGDEFLDRPVERNALAAAQTRFPGSRERVRGVDSY